MNIDRRTIEEPELMVISEDEDDNCIVSALSNNMEKTNQTFPWNQPWEKCPCLAIIASNMKTKASIEETDFESTNK